MTGFSDGKGERTKTGGVCGITVRAAADEDTSTHGKDNGEGGDEGKTYWAEPNRGVDLLGDSTALLFITFDGILQWSVVALLSSRSSDTG